MDKRDIQEQLRSVGGTALEGVRKALKAGSVRRLRVTDPNGRVLVQLPFTATVVGAFLAPVWASAAVLAAVATGHAVDVERVDVEGKTSGTGRKPVVESEVHAPH